MFFFITLSRTTKLILLTVAIHIVSFAASGPGLPTAPAPQDRVLKGLFGINRETLNDKHNGSAFFDGWLVALTTAGIAFLDVSDIENIKIESVHKMVLAEPYCMAASPSLPGGKWGFVAYAKGLKAMDLTDIKNPKVTDIPVNISGVNLTGKEYTTRIEQFALQYPYAFIPMTQGGMAVLDISDMNSPKVLKHIKVDDAGIDNLGYAWVVGNILAVFAHNQKGYVIFDVSDPADPKVLAAKTDNLRAYGNLMNGDALYENPKENHGVQKIDISDPKNPKPESAMLGGKAGGGGYLALQDGFAHVGCSGYGYAKINLTTKSKVAEIKMADFKPFVHKDVDYATGYGNLAVVGDDDNGMTTIFCHQSELDKISPEVNMVNPNHKAVQQAVTSRVGITLTDQIDFMTVSDKTFIIKKAGSGDPVSGRYTVIRTNINFCPDSPFEKDAVYEVVVPAGGIKDVAGNAVKNKFKSIFSTGKSLVGITPTLKILPARVQCTVQKVIGIQKGDFEILQTKNVYNIFGKKVTVQDAAHLTIKGILIISDK